jgi:hypothetical protein
MLKISNNCIISMQWCFFCGKLVLNLIYQKIFARLLVARKNAEMCSDRVIVGQKNF